MQKLYIIEYGNRGTSWYWAHSKEDAIKEAKEADEATDNEIEEAEIWTIDEAVLNTDVIKAIDRFIIKPLKRL